MTVKEAFQKLALSLSVSIKNPFFVNKRLYNDFAEIADEIEEGGGSSHEYSTDEQLVGKWIDGSNLYEKTIIFNTGVIASNTDFNITSYMPENCVVVNSSFILTYSYENVAYRNVNLGAGYAYYNGTHYISFNIGSATYDKHVELTIQYTKVTT